MLKLPDCIFCGVQTVTKTMKNKPKRPLASAQPTPLPVVSQRLAALRLQMKKLKVTALLVPRQDEFQGEYVPAHAERLKWLTGFTGSWGVAIIRMKDAHIFVDGRYTVQVRNEVDANAFIYQHLINTPPSTWIVNTLKAGDKLGFDPWLATAADADKLHAACVTVGAKLVPLASNPIDAIWSDQPKRPSNPIFLHPTKLAGQSVSEKLKQVSDSLQSSKCESLIIADPSSVAWLFNIRGLDVPYSPVVPAFALVKRKGPADIFIDPAMVPKAVMDQLSSFVQVKKPQAILSAITALAKKKGSILVEAGSCPAVLRNAISKVKGHIVYGSDPCTMPKAQKNKTEQEGARAAQHRDGVAMSQFLCWLEGEAPKGWLDELVVAEKLSAFRAAYKEFRMPSFETISAAGANAASPHYHSDPAAPHPLRMNSIFLVDSGAQYDDGTTDITRTVLIGQPTDEMKDRFTRVLKGMIQVSMLRFPAGTSGMQIDAFARAALWKAGLDYDHGTGHGVGSFLSVHEGPARISKTGSVALKTGMILSNEPGFYKDGAFGIRIENLLMVSAPEKIEGGEREMHSFETLTLCPIERRLIETRLLTKEEIDWLDSYHARVWRELRPFMNGSEATWLTRVCGPIR
jgi:Xaa-Pro aminopeptidase